MDRNADGSSGNARVGVERIVVTAAAAAAVSVPVAMSGAAIAAPSRDGATLVLAAAGAVILAVALTALSAALRGSPALFLRLAGRLPATLDGASARRPLRATLWVLAALLAFFQIIRLAAFMTDPQLRFGAAVPSDAFSSRHMCLAAYLHAADLARRADANVYAAGHYPVFQAVPPEERTPVESPVANLGLYLEDAFEYPPPFLVLPRLGLLFSNDFLTLRTAWFALQLAAFLVFAAWLAASVGGRRGLLAGLLLPVLWLGLPILFNFQFGQFHLACVVLALAGMLAFQHGKNGLGGALLGAAVVTKLFPGLLLVALAAARRWRPVLWTAGFCVGYVVLGVAVLGWAPYQSFLEYHLPRLLSGEAFSFFLRRDLIVASNWGIYAIPFKLERLGVPGMSAGLANLLNSAYTVVLVAATVVAGRRAVPRDQQPLVWLGLLILGSLRSPMAPSAYTPVPALWLLTLLAVEVRGALALAAFVAAWLALGSLPPLPDPRATIAVWMGGQVLMLALGFWAVLRRPRADDGRVPEAAPEAGR